MFAFRMRAHAAAHFEFEDVLTVTWPDAVATFQSEYTGGDDGRAYPVTIHGEIRGPGTSLEEAEPRLAATIGNVLPIISLAANAAIADPLAVASFGTDLSTPQPFIGYETPRAEEWPPTGKRRIDTDATLALAACVGTHPQTQLLQGAIEFYRRALGHWIPEERLLAGEFLFIAAETFSRFLLEARAAEGNMTPKNLVRHHGLPGEAQLRRRFLEDEVFAGDADAFAALEAASNGFEHGYMTVDHVRGLMEPVLERSFGYLRQSMINAVVSDATIQGRLLIEEFEEPRALVPIVRFVHGELAMIDPDGTPPALDIAPVDLEWRPSPPVATKNEDGETQLTFKPNITVANLQAGTKLDVFGHGMRAAHLRVTSVDAEKLPAEHEPHDGTVEVPASQD
jgi:hypothetical protein